MLRSERVNERKKKERLNRKVGEKLKGIVTFRNSEKYKRKEKKGRKKCKREDGQKKGKCLEDIEKGADWRKEERRKGRE